MNIEPVNNILSEQDIKEITLSFLKGYYRGRERIGETELSSDVRGAGGIIADGHLSFPQPGGTWFVATFEATSFDTRMEVRFTQRRNLLFWDAVVFAIWGAAVWAAFNLVFHLAPMKKYGPHLPVVITVSVFTMLFFVFHLAAAYWRRYRHIYAVEQFKQYYANEQWISVAKDVFYDSQDTYYEELRRQCIFFGFGLVMIDKNRRPQIHLTPARVDMFSGKRRAVLLLTENQLMNRIRTFADQKWIRDFQGKLTRVFSSADPEFLKRFGGKYPKHWGAVAGALLLILFLWYEEYKPLIPRTVDEKLYAEEVVQQARKFPKDPPGYAIDTPLFHPAPFLDDRISYLDEWLEDRLAEKAALRQRPRNAMGSQDGEHITLYDCARFRNFTGVKFILMDAPYPDFDAALLRIEQLQAQGIQAGAFWLGCFDTRTGEYVVFLGPIFNNQREALQRAQQLEWLRRDSSGKDFLTVKAISN